LHQKATIQSIQPVFLVFLTSIVSLFSTDVGVVCGVIIEFTAALFLCTWRLGVNFDMRQSVAPASTHDSNSDAFTVFAIPFISKFRQTTVTTQPRQTIANLLTSQSALTDVKQQSTGSPAVESNLPKQRRSIVYRSRQLASSTLSRHSRLEAIAEAPEPPVDSTHRWEQALPDSSVGDEDSFDYGSFSLDDVDGFSDIGDKAVSDAQGGGCWTSRSSGL
jgi:hypothetical protein